MRGDHEINEGSLERLFSDATLELADQGEASENGFAIGYVGVHELSAITEFSCARNSLFVIDVEQNHLAACADDALCRCVSESRGAARYNGL